MAFIRQALVHMYGTVGFGVSSLGCLHSAEIFGNLDKANTVDDDTDGLPR